MILNRGDALREHVEPAGEEHLNRIMSASEHIEGIADTAGDFVEILDGDGELELHPVALESVRRTEVEKARSAHADAVIEMPESVPSGYR